MAGIDTTELEQFTRALKQSPGKLAALLLRAGVNIAKIYEHTLKNAAPVGVTSDLANSMTGEAMRKQNGVTAQVVTSAPHAMAANYGRKAGRMPPVEPIRRWVELRLFKHAGASDSEDLNDQIDRTTFLIRRKIAQGTSRHQRNPHRYIEKGMKRAEPFVKTQLEKLDDEIERMLE